MANDDYLTPLDARPSPDTPARISVEQATLQRLDLIEHRLTQAVALLGVLAAVAVLGLVAPWAVLLLSGL